MAKEIEKLKNALSRRSARTFEEENGTVESGRTGQTAHESRPNSGDEKEIRMSRMGSRRASINIDSGLITHQKVNLGKDLSNIFPRTVDDLEKHVTKSLQAAKASSKEKVDSKPLNFGVVLPGSVYRSSFPQQGDFKYLETLSLKTIVSLVKKDFTPEFEDFMKESGISHIVIDMQGTKKVDIPEHIMRDIMTLALDQANYPLLIHCNHGKHRTGCAVAVIRHIAGWTIDHIIEEYTGYAAPKVRDCDLKYITEYRTSSLEGLFVGKTQHRAVRPTLVNSKMARFIIFTLCVFAIWYFTFLLCQETNVNEFTSPLSPL